MLISQAYAQAAAPAPGGGDFLISLLPLILIFVVFYFLLIRPQQKRMKDHRAMVEAVKRNDQIVTAGGLIGKVQKVETDHLMVEVAQGVQVKLQRQSVSDVLNKTGAAAAPANDTKKSGGMFGGLLGGGKGGDRGSANKG